MANKIIWFEENEFKKRVDIAKNNTVEIPVLFTDEKIKNAIREQAKLYGKEMMGNIMTTPELEIHDNTDMSE